MIAKERLRFDEAVTDKAIAAEFDLRDPDGEAPAKQESCVCSWTTRRLAGHSYRKMRVARLVHWLGQLAVTIYVGVLAIAPLEASPATHSRRSSTAPPRSRMLLPMCDINDESCGT
jgi:hypothetical protein